MIEEYRINAGDIPRYELEILKSGICRGLVPAGYYSENDTVVILPDFTGYSSIEDKLSGEEGDVLNGFRVTIKILRSVTEALKICGEYLLQPGDLSVAAEDIFLTTDFDAGLLLKPGQPEICLAERIVGLAAEIAELYPAAGGAELAERIAEANRSSRLNASGLLRLLSRWEIELNK